MRRITEVRHLIAHTRFKVERATIPQFGVEFAFKHIEDVASVAPVIRKVAGCVLHHPDPHIANVEGAPESAASLA